MKALLFCAYTAAAVAVASPTSHRVKARQSTAAPTAQVKNGTYVGSHNPTYNQDFFLGVPFAQPPLQDLRFRNPVPLNDTWSGTRPATNYAFECIGYGVGSQTVHELESFHSLSML
jgi:acetylcholinesterase